MRFRANCSACKICLTPLAHDPRMAALQVISTIIKQVLKGLPPMTLKHGSKVPADYFGGKSAGESEVHLFEGTLLTGCLDKAVYGNFGIIHGVQVRSSSPCMLQFLVFLV